jgi:hypothetical protein
MAGGRGGRRAGAGRPAGSGWLPAVTEMRAAAAERLVTVVGSEQDPLAVVLAVCSDPTQDTPTRLGAASIALPYLYPRLSATQVSATHLTAKVDPGDLINRIAERVARLAAPTPTEGDGTGEATLIPPVKQVAA